MTPYSPARGWQSRDLNPVGLAWSLSSLPPCWIKGCRTEPRASSCGSATKQEPAGAEPGRKEVAEVGPGEPGALPQPAQPPRLCPMDSPFQETTPKGVSRCGTRPGPRPT